MIGGYYIIRDDDDIVINCTEDGKGGYNAVPLSIDPHNWFNTESKWAKLRQYIGENPNMRVEEYVPPPTECDCDFKAVK